MIDADDPWWTWADRMPLSPTRAERGNARRREMLRQIRERTRVLCGNMIFVDRCGKRYGWFCNCGTCPF